MTFRELITPPPTLFRSDPQSVEVVTGWFIAYTGFLCWSQEWFGYFLSPRLAHLHGYEWIVMVVLITVGTRHALRGHSRNLHKRARQAFWAAGIFTALGIVLLQNHDLHWRVPGAGYAFLTSVVHCWVYLRLKRVIA